MHSRNWSPIEFGRGGKRASDLVGGSPAWGVSTDGQCRAGRVPMEQGKVVFMALVRPRTVSSI